MDSAFGTSLGWLLAGVFLGWLGNWLFDRLYRRDGPAAGELSTLRLEGLAAEIDGLRAELGDLRQGLAAQRTTPAMAPPAPPALAAEPVAPAPPPLDPATPLSPMELLARRAAVPQAAHPPWSPDEDRAAQARLDALRDFQAPGPAPAAPA